MATNKQLTVHNASVTTMAVEVKTIKIDNRQVTQGIFRQLIEEPLIAEDGTLNGVPWGHVTWHPERCDDSKRRHWHIVWQRGSELRRAWVATVPDFDLDAARGGEGATFWCDEADILITARVSDWLHGRREEMPLFAKQASWGATFHDTRRFATKHGFAVEGIVSDAAMAAVKARVSLENAAKSVAQLGSEQAPSWTKARLTEAEAALTSATAALDAEFGEGTYKECSDALMAVTQAEADRRQRHRDVLATLAQLPQLFIGG